MCVAATHREKITKNPGYFAGTAVARKKIELVD